MLKRTTLLYILLFLLGCFNAQTTTACKCKLQLFSTDSDRADLIFQGTVLTRTDSLSIGKVFYTFRINKVWKGNSAKTIIISTNYGGPACGDNFIVNQEYVIFSTALATSRCTRNSTVSDCPDISRLDYKYISKYREQFNLNTLPILSKVESGYFNNILKNKIYKHSSRSNDIDFIDKKIAIFDHGFISKSIFFTRYGDKEISMNFEKFTDKEIAKSGGYYGIFCIPGKKALRKRQKSKFIKHLVAQPTVIASPPSE